MESFFWKESDSKNFRLVGCVCLLQLLSSAVLMQKQPQMIRKMRCNVGCVPIKLYLSKQLSGDLCGGPVVKTSPSRAGYRFDSWLGAQIPHASWLKNQSKHKGQEQYCNKFNKDFKNGPH